MDNNIFNQFIDFDGEENEKEFLEKCYEQWEIACNANGTDMQKLMIIGSIFHEIEHRLREL